MRLNCHAKLLLLCGLGALPASWLVSYVGQDSQQLPAYSLVDLSGQKVLGGIAVDGAYPAAINNDGDVVAECCTRSGHRAVLWRAGNSIALPLPSGYTDATPVDISDSGIVVGYASQSFPAKRDVAVLWQHGRVHVLGGSAPGQSLDPDAVNRSGVVVGGIGEKGKWRGGFLWRNGVLQPLPLAVGKDINDAGEVVGWREVGGTKVAGIWMDGHYQDVGSALHLSLSTLRRVNNRGDVLGYGREIGWFVYSDGQARRLPQRTDVNASAWDMNRSGDVVGTIANASTGDRYAALWRNGRLYNLNDVLRPGSGWRLSIAFAINDRGEIAGVGEHAGHGARAFLLVPHSRGQDRSLWLRERGGSSR